MKSVFFLRGVKEWDKTPVPWNQVICPQNEISLSHSELAVNETPLCFPLPALSRCLSACLSATDEQPQLWPRGGNMREKQEKTWKTWIKCQTWRKRTQTQKMTLQRLDAGCTCQTKPYIYLYLNTWPQHKDAVICFKQVHMLLIDKNFPGFLREYDADRDIFGNKVGGKAVNSTVRNELHEQCWTKLLQD